MKTLKIKPPPTNEGWSIHVYDSDRHLCCTIEPSHGWALGIGVGAGILISVLFSNLAAATNPQKPTVERPSSTAAPSTAESISENLMPPWVD